MEHEKCHSLSSEIIHPANRLSDNLCSLVCAGFFKLTAYDPHDIKSDSPRSVPYDDESVP